MYYSTFDTFIVYGQAIASLILFVALAIAAIVGIIFLIRATCAINVYIRKNSVSQPKYTIPQVPETDDFHTESTSDNFFSKVDNGEVSSEADAEDTSASSDDSDKAE